MNDRIKPIAMDLKAETIAKNWDAKNLGDAYIKIGSENKPTGEGLDFNARWVQNKVNNGYHIFDIGPKRNSS